MGHAGISLGIFGIVITLFAINQPLRLLRVPY